MDSATVGLVEAELKELLRTELNVAPDILATADTSTELLTRGVGLDSVEAFNLACAVEERYRIEIGDDFTPETFATLGTLARYILEKRPSGR